MKKFTMRQYLDLVLNIEPFEIFTAIHNAKILFAMKISLQLIANFLTAYK